LTAPKEAPDIIPMTQKRKNLLFAKRAKILFLNEGWLSRLSSILLLSFCS
ncbi:unnamed protein product, partial [marine sediment metagenome]